MQNAKLGLDILNESFYMKESVAEFIQEQQGIFTQTYFDDVNAMYRKASLQIEEMNIEFRTVFVGLRDAHLGFVDVVDPDRFDATLIPTVEGELSLSRKSTGGGWVKIVIDEDLISFLFLPEKHNPSKEVVEFFEPANFTAKDYTNLLYRFFTL